MLEDVRWRSRGEPAGIGIGVGDPVRDTLRDVSGDDSLSVVIGEVAQDEGEPREPTSPVLEGERVRMEPMRFLINVALDPAIFKGELIFTSCASVCD